MTDIPRATHWTLIRLLAALSIMANHTSHLFWNIPTPWIWELVDEVRVFVPGVPVLFFASGFLVSLSLRGSSDWLEFSLKRILRVYPPLWASVIVCALLLILLGQADLSFTFFAWLIGQLTFFQFWTPDILRDYGVGTPNGSLWVIIVIVQFYLICVFLPNVDKWVSNRLGLWGDALVLLFLATVRLIFLSVADDSIASKLINCSLIPWMFFFTLGYYCMKHYRIIQEARINILYLIIVYVALFYLVTEALNFDHTSNRSHPIYFSALALALVRLAYARPFSSIVMKKIEDFFVKNDPTFGMFVYHMLVINVMVEYQLIENVVLRVLTFAALTFSIAFLSMRFLEQPIRDHRDQIIATITMRSSKNIS